MNKTLKNNQHVFNLVLKMLSISALVLSTSAFAGAWVGEDGSVYLKLGYADFSSDTYRGNDPTFESFNGQNTSLYGEYGLGNDFSIYGSLLYQTYDQKYSVTGTSSAKGFSDTEIGLRYQWQADPFVLSTSFLVKTPFLYSKDDGLGNNQEDYEAKILIGKGLNEYGYFGVEVGYRLRTGDPSDEYRYLLEYGFNITPDVYFRTKLDGIFSAENSSAISTPNTGNLSNPLEFDSGKVELTTGYNFKENIALKGLGVEFTYTREIYGKNILQGDTFQLGITKAL